MNNELSEKFEPIIRAWAQKVCEGYLYEDKLRSLFSGYQFQDIIKTFAMDSYKAALEKIKPELHVLIEKEIESRKQEIAKEAVDYIIKGISKGEDEVACTVVNIEDPYV